MPRPDAGFRLQTTSLIAIVGAESTASGPAGLFERLSIGAPSLWSVLLVVRLLLDARRGSPWA